jgi:hypothetical protein
MRVTNSDRPLGKNMTEPMMLRPKMTVDRNSILLPMMTGSMTQNKAPRIGPMIVPRPPMMLMDSNSMENVSPKFMGCRYEMVNA